MPTIITASELRAVLGVSSSLYSDAVLNDCIDAAEIVILPMLTTFSVPIQSVVLEDNVATFDTTLPHEFTEGSSIVVAGCGTPFNGTRTVNAEPTEFTFSCNITNADVLFKNIIPAGYKLAAAMTHRKVTDPQLAALTLKEKGIPESAIWEPAKLKSIASLEKLAAKGQIVAWLGDLVQRPEGAPKLVRDSASAEQDFA